MSKKSDKTIFIALTYLDEKLVKIKKSFLKDSKKRVFENKISLDNDKYFFISENKKNIILSYDGHLYLLKNHQNLQIDKHDNIFTKN